MKQFWNSVCSFKYGVLALILIRAILNAILPLMDKTEARYAEIARLMVSSNNWITPHIDYGVPFWAKPPLSTWMSALSFKWWGVSEFTARLPYLCMAIVLVLFIGKYGKRQGLSFYLPGFILLTIPEFLLHAGVVSTDTTLAFCVALCMLSFWEALKVNASWYWQYLIAVGLGLGMLAKGPIILVLCIPPIVVWLWIHEKFQFFFKTVSIWKGLLIMGVIAVPWYVLAERATPGFIDYFIVGEHYKRFVDANWKGDKYGFPKSQPLGMIWVFLIIFSGSWIIVLGDKLWAWRSQLLQNKWLSFLVLWLIWTPLFFTLSKSLIHPYIMPVMVPMALLVSYSVPTLKKIKLWNKLALVLPVIAIVLVPFFTLLGHTAYYAPTDKYLIKQALLRDQSIYSLEGKSYSGQFYSKGRISVLSVEALIQKIQGNSESFQILISQKMFETIPLELRKTLKPLAKNRKKRLYQFQNNNQ
jgi:4-amino-4-deoxy-L-arabinose transferase-like glycosyltransferase